jgi:hypothetical protein
MNGMDVFSYTDCTTLGRSLDRLFLSFLNKDVCFSDLLDVGVFLTREALRSVINGIMLELEFPAKDG